LRFWSRLQFNGNDGGTYKILIAPASSPNLGDLTSYTEVIVWTEPQLNPNQQVYTEKLVDLPTTLPAGPVVIAFLMEGDNADRWYVDDVMVVEKCQIPTNLTAEEIGLTTAELNWDELNADQWEVEVISADAAPTGTGVVVDDPTYSPTLIADSNYKYYVRAICGPGNYSDWSLPYTFHTVGVGDNCTVPIVISALPYSTVDNTSNYGDEYTGIPGTGCGTMEWQQYLNGNDVVYAYTAAATGTISIDMTDSANSSGLFVYDSCADIGINCVAGGIVDWQELPVSIPEFDVTAGQTYYIVISTWGPFPQVTPYDLVIQQVNCTPPVGLPTTGVGETSAQLSWTNPTAATSWQIVVQAPGAGIPAGAGTTVSTNSNHTVTQTFAGANLVEATPYEYYVRSNCGDGTFSAWAGPYLFNTMICEPEDQCTFTFVMTDLWGDGWNGNTMTVSQNGIPLAVIGDTFTTGNGPVEVTVQVCNGVPMQLFWNADGSFPQEVGVAIQNGFDQTFFIKDFGEGTQNTSLYTGTVDCDTPLCIAPTNLTVNNQTTTTVDLGWDGPTGPTYEYEYYYVEAGGAAPTAATPGTSTFDNPVTISGLDASTNYDFYVRYVCSATTNSDWSELVNSHTEVCEADQKCVYTFEMTSQNGWGYGGNTMSIFQGGVPIATIGEDFDWGTSSSVDIPLCPGVEMELVWNLGGWDAFDKGITVYTPFAEDIYVKPPGTGAQGTTLFTGVISCDPPPCPKPQDLSATDLQLTSALLDWNEMGDAGTWEVWVLPYGSPAPTTPGTVTNAHPFSTTLIEPLTSGTTYVFYVRANCGATDGYSTWSGPFVFTTAIENDDCDGALPVPVNAGIECTEVATGSMTGATGSGVQPSCSWMAPDFDVWFEFVATSEVHSISVNGFDNFFNHAVYESDCGNLVEISCDFNESSTVSGLTVGNTYLIQVYTTFMNNPAAPAPLEVCIVTPTPIITDNTTYTVEEIVSDVLVTTSCAQVSNISWTTGTSNGWGGSNGIAMFEKGTSAFPLAKGVVLATGNAMQSPGPNSTTQSNGFWPGDDQLFNYIQDLGIDPNLMDYNDATVLEFDFIPLTTHMSFPFVFASEEYGTYQCDFSDAFAFFLTDENGVTTNLAVIPGTTIPVSVITIRDGAYNTSCGSANEEYFDEYYEVGDMAAPINFNGNTISMVAESDVVIGQTYHIKLVIADRNDNSMDSAVFIGPFDIGAIDLGVDLTEDNGTALCAGQSATLDTGLNPAEYEFIWYNGDDVIEGETGPSMEVTESGEYTVSAQYLASTCAGSDSIIVEFLDPVKEVTGDPIDLNACDDSGFFKFDLTLNTDLIIAGATSGHPLEITYHLTEDEANANTGALDVSYTNTTQFLQTIFVRIFDTVTGCTGVKEFNLVVGITPPQFELTDDLTICEGTSGTLTVTPIDFNGSEANYVWTLNGDVIPNSNVASITVTEEGVYEVTVSVGCTGTQTVNVDVVPVPVADILPNTTACDVFVLPGLSANNTYHTQPGGAGSTLAVGQEISTAQTVYVFAQAGTCTDESSFTLAFVDAPTFEVTGDCVNNEYVMQVTFLDEIYSADNVSFEWTNPSGTVIGANQPTAVAEVEGTYVLTITPMGFDVNCPVSLDVEVENAACLMPKGISPNSDGMNDSFDLTGFNVAKLSIFNRYGREVYSKTEYTNEWHGQTDGDNELPTGTYYYMIERSNGENKTGWVYINRQEN
jgi:gliding motility-associated-like protein